ncbi:hypothetical protein K438DRAFT_1964470 [Mycena galopus ATCC 62051]|nr:hypothetical protein K438DRAFT_1964470 [Mycena galopus ATCC 62051]
MALWVCRVQITLVMRHRFPFLCTVDLFLGRFSPSSYFFLDPVQLRQSTLLRFPFGHESRPSPALLSVVYLWGSVLLDVPLAYPHTPDALLTCVIQNICQDLISLSLGSNIMFETLQAEIMLSLYFMHSADPVQGRYHCGAATSIVLNAGLHLTGSTVEHNQAYPAFPMQTSQPPNALFTPINKAHAFGAIVILSSCWVVMDGAPSLIPLGLDASLGASSQVGCTIQGDSIDGLTPIALLAKAGALLWRAVSFTRGTSGPDSLMFVSLERRLLAFRQTLPPPLGAQESILTRALTDLAILRLHAPYSFTSDHSRLQALAACDRIKDDIEGLEGMNVRHVDPVFGPIYWTIATFYVSEITFASQHSLKFNFPDNLGRLVNLLAWLAPHGPIFECCFTALRIAYEQLPQ